MDNSVFYMTVLQNIENYVFSSVLKDFVFDIIQIENSVRKIIYITEFSILSSFMHTLVALDRDGTINKDEDWYLGSTSDWKERITFLPGVVEGIRQLNRIQGIDTVIITNQAGVARKFFSEERMHEVNQHIVNELEKQGAAVKGYFACPYVSQRYAAERHRQGKDIDDKYVRDNHPEQKPNIGMLVRAAKLCGYSLESCHKSVIGDRVSDIEMALRAGGRGYLVESWKTNKDHDTEKVILLAAKHPGQIMISKNFFNAVEHIILFHISGKKPS